MVKRRIERSIRVFEKRCEAPLNGISNCVAELEVTNKDPIVLNYVKIIKSCNLQLVRSCKMITEHTQLVNHLYLHKRQRIDLVRYVRGIVRAAAPYAFQSGISISYHIPREPIITITETAPLTAILGHLLSNACRFQKPDDAIFVDMYRKDNDVFILVWDRGPGIPPSVAPHIFKPYYYFSPDGASLVGTGLGLTLAKGFAQFLGGDLSFAPYGGGSLFAFVLPLCADKRKRPRLSKPPAPISDMQRIMSDAVPNGDDDQSHTHHDLKLI